MSETTPLPLSIRPAVAADARAIAELFLISSDGLAEYIWSAIAAPGEALVSVGERRYARTGVPFSYQNCAIAECGGEIAGMAHSFLMPERAPDDIETDPVVRPTAALEDPGSLYLSGLAIHAPFRRRGFGSTLLQYVHRRARDLGTDRVSLICFDENVRAMTLYARFDYEVLDRRAIVPHPALHYTEGDAVLLGKRVSGSRKAWAA